MAKNIITVNGVKHEYESITLTELKGMDIDNDVVDVIDKCPVCGETEGLRYAKVDDVFKVYKCEKCLLPICNVANDDELVLYTKEDLDNIYDIDTDIEF